MLAVVAIGAAHRPDNAPRPAAGPQVAASLAPAPMPARTQTADIRSPTALAPSAPLPPERVDDVQTVISDIHRIQPSQELAAPPDPPRVFIHFTAGDDLAGQRAAALADSLRRQGFTVADLRAVPGTINRPSVRYFFQQDRTASQSLARALKADLGDSRVLPFLYYEPKPRVGTLEVWVPSR